MAELNMLVDIDAPLLAEAFPVTCRDLATQVADAVLIHLSPRRWTSRFEVNVCSEVVSIPHRLLFATTPSLQGQTDTNFTIGKCLESRSNDGFQRQRAARALLPDVHPWSAPFIIALLGEYLIEILHDINGALTPVSRAVLAEFIAQNPGYWALTKQRVASYWNVYYRHQFTRGDYVGFSLLDILEKA